MPPTPTPPSPATSQRTSVPLYSLKDKITQGDTATPIGEIDAQSIRDAGIGIAMAPQLNRDVRETRQTYRASAGQGAVDRQRGEQTLQSAAALPEAPQAVRNLAQALRARIAENKQKSAERAKVLAHLSGAIKRSLTITIAAALYVAIASDILSIFDLGWLTSWGIIVFTFFIARRITKINKGAEQAQKAYQKTLQDIRLTHQRIGAVFPEEKRRPLFQGAKNVLEGRFGSYLTRFTLETAGVQGFELIPILDWLPAYTGQVVKIAIDQYGAYQKARRLLPPLQEAFAQAEQLESLELSLIEQRLTQILYLSYAYPLEAPREVAPQPSRPPLRTTPPSRPAVLIPEPAL